MHELSYKAGVFNISDYVTHFSERLELETCWQKQSLI